MQQNGKIATPSPILVLCGSQVCYANAKVLDKLGRKFVTVQFPELLVLLTVKFSRYIFFLLSSLPLLGLWIL